MKTFELNAQDPHGTIAMRKKSFLRGGKTVLRFHAPSFADAIYTLIWNFEFSAEDFAPHEVREVKKTPPHCDQFNSPRIG